MFGNKKTIETKVKTEEDKKKDAKKAKKGIFSFLSSKKLKKPNMVAIIYLRNNGIAETGEVESKRGFFIISGKTYHENRDCIYTIIGKDRERIPLAIIPEWSLIPLGTKRWDDKPMLEKFAELQDHTLRGIRHAELVKMGDKSDSKSMTTKQIILLVLACIVGAAVLLNYI